MKPRKFRKKSVVVEAYKTNEELIIETPRGVLKADAGDWIITGTSGEVYPCKPDIFVETYEPVGGNKFRKKPVIVEAYQAEEPELIETLEGPVKAEVGDWVITGVQGEKYPCKPETFEQIYEPLDGKELVLHLLEEEQEKTKQAWLKDGDSFHYGKQYGLFLARVFIERHLN